jgi:hypothetical protein
VCVTQISPTLFSLSHQSPQGRQENSTYGAHGHESGRMDLVTSPEGLHLDSAGGQSLDFIATVRIRLRQCSEAAVEAEGGGSSGVKNSHTVDITVEFERFSDFTDVLTELNRILSEHGNTAIQSDPTGRKITFDGVEKGSINCFTSFVESLCVVFPRPMSVFETSN